MVPPAVKGIRMRIGLLGKGCACAAKTASASAAAVARLRSFIGTPMRSGMGAMLSQLRIEELHHVAGHLPVDRGAVDALGIVADRDPGHARKHRAAAAQSWEYGFMVKWAE